MLISVDGCYTYKTIRNDDINNSLELGCMIQYFECSKVCKFYQINNYNISLFKKVFYNIYFSQFIKVFCPIGRILVVCVYCLPNSLIFEKW